MNEIIITNIHHGTKKDTKRAVYVGRPSPLGNPLSITGQWTRDYVCDMYDRWIDIKLKEGQADVLNELDRIADMVLDGTGKPVYLECFCAPARCHGESIRRVIHEAIEASKK